jgi:hypothetical protein
MAMPRKSWLLPAVALVTLVACGGADETDDRRADPGEAAEGEFDPMPNTLDEAREVESLTRQQKDRLDAALDEAAGEAPP